MLDLSSVPPHQDMRSHRFAYKTEEIHPDVVELLTNHAFPLSHSLVSLIQMWSQMFVYFMLCSQASTRLLR